MGANPSQNRPELRAILNAQYRWRFFIFGAGFLFTLALVKLCDRLGFRSAFGGALMLTFLLGFLFYDFQTWRCPVCDEFLGKSRSIFLVPDGCVKCGQRWN